VRAAKRALLPLIYRQVAGFLTIGDNNEAYLAHYGVSRNAMFRSPYPTNDAHFTHALERAASDRREVRRQLGIDEQAIVALFVGKLIERKCPADLLAATQLVRSRSALDLIALFAGDGELRSSLEASNNGAARFAGFVNQEALPSMYAAADMIVHPAHNDPHPIAVTEGVLMGLPAVVSDRIGSVGPTDTVRVGQNGLVVPTGDVPALAAALQTLAGDTELRTRMGEASSGIGREMGMGASVRGYLAAVHSVTQSRRR
jgi:glycosyltransferase involved in cell wall biosynthesis